MTTYYIIVAVC